MYELLRGVDRHKGLLMSQTMQPANLIFQYQTPPRPTIELNHNSGVLAPETGYKSIFAPKMKNIFSNDNVGNLKGESSNYFLLENSQFQQLSAI